MTTKQDSVNWLKHTYKGEFSELGKNVAWFLDKMWGLHNINRTSLSNVDWSNDTWIELVYNHELSTVDSAHLTRLVVIAHQMMLRVSITGAAPRYLRLVFHQRTTRNRENGFYNWCPDINDHVQAITKYHPAIDAQTQPSGLRTHTQLGPKLFEFSSFQRWVNKAKSWFANSGVPTRETICIDAVGRICTCGKEFMRARDENTFPVAVYHIDPNFVPKQINYEQLPEKTDDELELEGLLMQRTNQ